MRHLLVVIYQYDGWDAEQVEQVHTDTQTGHIGDEHEPSVAMRFVGVVFPLQNQPEYHSGEGRREGVNLTLYSREPEGIAEGIDECAHHTRCLDGDQLAGGHLLPVADDELACQMGDGPEEEHDADGTEECAHRIHHLGYLRGITGEMCEEIAHEHEEWCPRWVTDLLLVGSCNKLRTVPETGCRFNCGAIYECRNDECDPSEDIVH